MFWKRFFSITTLALLIFISACSMISVPPTDSGTGPDTTAAIETRAAEIVASTAEVQTAIAKGVESTLAAMVTDTPEFTFTASLTLTPTSTRKPSKTPTLKYTLTSKVPMVSITVQTNCRKGPGTPYDVLGIMNVGETAQVVGRNAAGDFWVIKLPSNTSITCWLWGKYAKVVGSTNGLPVITPPPTPTQPTATLAPDFLLTYDSSQFCQAPGWRFYVNFKIVNIGGLTWQSVQVFAKDLTAGEDSASYPQNFFMGYGCGPGSDRNDIPPGQTGITAAHFDDTSRVGHNFSATIKLCSQHDMAGVCLEKSITFVP
jgi:hypothetical protein